LQKSGLVNKYYLLLSIANKFLAIAIFISSQLLRIFMEHSHNVCPVCTTVSQNNEKEECDRCGWILKVEDKLDLRTSNLLLAWAIRYYNNIVDLEGRGKYYQHRFNKRLDDQRDDINLLKNQMRSIFENFPEINPALSGTETIVDLQKNISLDIENFNKSTNISAIEESETVPIDRQEENNSTYSELPKSQQEIISDYYHNSSQFAVKYHPKTVNITKDSINANRGNESKIVILEEINRGNYWVFDFNNCTYLVPVEDKYINQHSYTTISTIFEGRNYTPGYQKIQLIKPAIVSIEPNTNPQTWRLQQQGELVFL
jgi:predicted nucleic acid-binding Zn ribbon protein